MSWESHLKLQFNASTCYVMSFSTRKKNFSHVYYLRNSTLTSKTSCHDLGGILTQDLSWDKHYSFISARAFKILGLIRRSFSSSLTTPVKRKHVFRTFSINVLFSYLAAIRDIRSLECIQPHATRLHFK